eukprot:1141944-Pelagomonas_calceolata.AAC.3
MVASSSNFNESQVRSLCWRLTTRACTRKDLTVKKGKRKKEKLRSGNSPYINQGKGDTLVKKSRDSPPKKKELVGIWKVTGSTRIQNLAVRGAFVFTSVPNGNKLVGILNGVGMKLMGKLSSTLMVQIQLFKVVKAMLSITRPTNAQENDNRKEADVGLVGPWQRTVPGHLGYYECFAEDLGTTVESVISSINAKFTHKRERKYMLVATSLVAEHALRKDSRDNAEADSEPHQWLETN